MEIKMSLQLYISKITNHAQGYTMVDVFSTLELAQAFQTKFTNKFYIKGKRWNYDVQIDINPIDAPSYPFLNEE
jgi:hypothetical protein